MQLHLLEIATVLTAFAAGSVNAIPFAKRSAAVEFCTDNNIQGSCFVFTPGNDVCTNFDSSLNDQVSSVHVQAGTTCVLFADDGCSGQSIFIGSDVGELGDFNFNDLASSFQCSSA